MAAQITTDTRNHDEYTVGWVCALSKEQTAATAMLDQRHADLPKPPNDPNTYTLGSIGKHNIVIACLPKGKIGNNAAAAFAAQMVRTFPSIKVGLMVGIGGGIPPKVRLGDVVVSTPADQYPGVVQWDFGKTEKDGIFKRTGALNNPPSAPHGWSSNFVNAVSAKSPNSVRYDAGKSDRSQSMSCRDALAACSFSRSRSWLKNAGHS